MGLKETEQREKIKEYLCALVQKEASIFPSFVGLVQRVIMYMQHGIKDEELDGELKTLRGSFDILINNNKKEITYVRGNKVLEPVFTISLTELIKLREELELLIEKPSEQRAEEIERLLAKLSADEQTEANLVRKAA